MLTRLCFLTLLAALTLAGCAMSPGTVPVQDPAAGWADAEARIAVLSAYVASAQESAGDLDAGALAAAGAMRARHSEIQDLLRVGTLAQSNRSYLRIGESLHSVDAARHNALQQLLAGENRDRKILFVALAREVGLSLSAVEGLWSVQSAAQLPSGTRIQLPPKGPVFDRFLASEAGQRVGGAGEPEAWVALQ